MRDLPGTRRSTMECWTTATSKAAAVGVHSDVWGGVDGRVEEAVLGSVRHDNLGRS